MRYDPHTHDQDDLLSLLQLQGKGLGWYNSLAFILLYGYIYTVGKTVEYHSEYFEFRHRYKQGEFPGFRWMNPDDGTVP